MGMVNKRGWLRVVEASISVLMVLAAFLVIPSHYSAENEKDNLNYLLDRIAKNDTLRGEILSYDTSDRPEDLENAYIIGKVSSFIENERKDINGGYFVSICGVGEECAAPNPDLNKNIFSSERLLSTNITSSELKPVKIRVYSWKGA